MAEGKRRPGQAYNAYSGGNSKTGRPTPQARHNPGSLRRNLSENIFRNNGPFRGQPGLIHLSEGLSLASGAACPGQTARFVNPSKKLNPLPLELARRINTLPGKRFELAYKILGAGWANPWRPVILAYNSLALSQYHRRDIAAVIKYLLNENLTCLTQPGNRAARQGAEYSFNLPAFADIYKNLSAGALCYTIDQARNMKPGKPRQRIDALIKGAARGALQLTGFTWHPVAAWERLQELPPAKRPEAWKQIRNNGRGFIKPSWKLAKNGRIYTRRPALQNLNAAFRRPEIIAGGGQLYEVDFSAQEPNIFLKITGRTSDFSYNEIPQDIRPDFKAFLTAALHGQGFQGFRNCRRLELPEAEIKSSYENYKRIAEERGFIFSGFNTKRGFCDRLQKIGANILLYTLELAYNGNIEQGATFLPLHDGIILEGEARAREIFDNFKQASVSILGSSLPIKSPEKL